MQSTAQRHFNHFCINACHLFEKLHQKLSFSFFFVRYVAFLVSSIGRFVNFPALNSRTKSEIFDRIAFKIDTSAFNHLSRSCMKMIRKYAQQSVLSDVTKTLRIGGGVQNSR